MNLGIRDQGEIGKLGILLIGGGNGRRWVARPEQGELLRQRRNPSDQLELRLELSNGPRGRDATLRTRVLGRDLDGDVPGCLPAHRGVLKRSEEVFIFGVLYASRADGSGQAPGCGWCGEVEAEAKWDVDGYRDSTSWFL
jgi:hypothetical protein